MNYGTDWLCGCVHGSPPLKVIEDPERGTVAEGLAEEGVQSAQHLQQLLRAVEERRQVSNTPAVDDIQLVPCCHVS